VNHLAEQDDEAEVCRTKGEPEPNADLRDNENVPLGEDIHEYFKREVLPHVPDAWIDTGKTDPLDGQVGLSAMKSRLTATSTSTSRRVI
jgi:type I restriction enzyme M protein